MIGTITTLQPSDFENGFICDSKQCPIALAMNRSNYRYPTVGNISIGYYNSEGKGISKKLTKDLSRKISSIDHRRNIKMFSIIERKNRFSLYKGGVK